MTFGFKPQNGGEGKRVRERLQLNTVNITNKLFMKLVMAVVGDIELLEAAIAERGAVICAQGISVNEFWVPHH